VHFRYAIEVRKTRLTAHEVVDDRVHCTVGIAQPVGQQGNGNHHIRTWNVHCVSVQAEKTGLYALNKLLNSDFGT